MNLFFSSKRILTFLFILAMAAACKQPETIVVDRDPETAADGDTLVQQPTEKQAAGFQRLNMGELQPVHSLDPLLADNSSSMRAIQLVYEGLVRFDESGDIIPAVAQRWSAGNSDRRYTFHLRPDIYYHDSNVFGSGTGRKLTAGDVVFVFERMADHASPPRAAQLFMNIEGYDDYYREQRLVYNPSLRKVDRISGIQTPNDTTVVFELNQPDPEFLQKLATPLAVIYPKEALKNNSAVGFTPVGSGPFSFSQRASDSTLVFSKFQDYYAASDIQLNRVDLISSDNEMNLLNAMEEGDIHFLPDLGPTLSKQLLMENGNLASSYNDRYVLTLTGTSEVALRHYPPSDLSRDTGADIGQLVETNASAFFEEFGPAVTDTSFLTDDSKIASMSNLRIQAPATDHPYGKALLRQLADLLGEQGGNLEIIDIHIPTRRTGLFFTGDLTLISSGEWADYPSLVSFTIQHHSLQRSDINNLPANRYAWWLDLRRVELPAFDNIN